MNEEVHDEEAGDDEFYWMGREITWPKRFNIGWHSPKIDMDYTLITWFRWRWKTYIYPKHLISWLLYKLQDYK